MIASLWQQAADTLPFVDRLDGRQILRVHTDRLFELLRSRDLSALPALERDARRLQLEPLIEFYQDARFEPDVLREAAAQVGSAETLFELLLEELPDDWQPPPAVQRLSVPRTDDNDAARAIVNLLRPGDGDWPAMQALLAGHSPAERPRMEERLIWLWMERLRLEQDGVPEPGASSTANWHDLLEYVMQLPDSLSRPACTYAAWRALDSVSLPQVRTLPCRGR